jgi:ferrous iron transport protein A
MVDPSSPNELRLGTAPRGYRGVIQALRLEGADLSVPSAELERQLVEMGFVEGATVEILHEGAIKRDPIAIRVNNATIALRRREAMVIVVSP